MSISITVSERIEKKILEEAKNTGQDVDMLVGNLVDEVWDEHFPENGASNPLAPFVGMFSSNATDTAERHSEILREAVKMPGGFAND